MKQSSCVRFEPGYVYITPGAARVLREAIENAQRYLDRHLTGQWGRLSKHRRQKNEAAISQGGTVITYYRTGKGGCLLIQTNTNRNLTFICEGAGDCPKEWP